MALRIITDSAADYEPAELKEKNIICVPLTINFKDVSYRDGIDIGKDEFYNKLLQGDDFPMTAQPSPEAFLAQYKAAEKHGDTVLAVMLSSGFSGTYQSAVIAKNMTDYEHIHVIDSLSAVTGLRMLVDTAVKMRDEEKPVEEIIETITYMIPRIQIYAMVDTLEYLHRGGRLTKAQAKMGELAKLKPIIQVEPGVGLLSVSEKCLGKGRAYKKLMALVKEMDIDFSYPVYFVYSHNKSNCEKFVDMISAEYEGIDKKHMYNIGPTIGTHVGSGAFGITCVFK